MVFSQSSPFSGEAFPSASCFAFTLPSKAIASDGSLGISTLTFGFAINNHLLPFRVGLDAECAELFKLRQVRSLIVTQLPHALRDSPVPATHRQCGVSRPLRLARHSRPRARAFR